MKSIVILSLLVAVALAMPHEFAAHHASNPSEIVRRNKALLHRVAKEVKVHKALASKKLRVAAPKRFTLGAPVTFESYGHNMTCGGKPELSVQLNVGECKQVSPSFAVKVTEYVNPPSNGQAAPNLCASMLQYEDDNCGGDEALMNTGCTLCQTGQFYTNCGGVYGALYLQSSCITASVTAPTCGSCNTTTIATFNKCVNVAGMGSVKALKLEQCSTVRLNLLHSCNSGVVYDSYVLGQGLCFGGMAVKDGH